MDPIIDITEWGYQLVEKFYDLCNKNVTTSMKHVFKLRTDVPPSAKFIIQGASLGFLARRALATKSDKFYSLHKRARICLEDKKRKDVFKSILANLKQDIDYKQIRGSKIELELELDDYVITIEGTAPTLESFINKRDFRKLDKTSYFIKKVMYNQSYLNKFDNFDGICLIKNDEISENEREYVLKKLHRQNNFSLVVKKTYHFVFVAHNLYSIRLDVFKPAVSDWSSSQQFRQLVSKSNEDYVLSIIYQPQENIVPSSFDRVVYSNLVKKISSNMFTFRSLAQKTYYESILKNNDKSNYELCDGSPTHTIFPGDYDYTDRDDYDDYDYDYDEYDNNHCGNHYDPCQDRYCDDLYQ